MENRVVFTLDQDLGPEDLNGLQTCVSDTFDHLTADVVTSGKRYAGLVVTKSTATQVGVAPGTLYAGGKMYDFPAALLQDFLTVLPVAGKKIVTVVAYGTEADTDTTPREFLIDEATGQSQARPIATRHRRSCNVQFAYGVEAPSPTAPLIDPGYVAVADILLSTTGVDSITQRTDTKVGSLDDHASRLGDLETFEESVGPKVTTLTSDLASLAKQLLNSVSTQLVAQLLIRLSVIEAAAKIPTTAVSSHANYYLDLSASDVANPLSNCSVREGIRMPAANQADLTLGLLNPLDVNAKIVNGLLLPAYTRQLWLQTGDAADQIRLSGYSYQTNQLVQKSMSRQVVQYGPEMTVCSNSTFWQTGSYDIGNNVFSRAGETFTVNSAYVDYAAGDQIHQWFRIQQYWTTTVTDTYTDTVTTTHPVNGSLVAESFIQGQDMWLDAVGLLFTKLADTGDASVAICEVAASNGLPDLTQVISVTALPRASMQVGAETVLPITPTFLSGGKRYAVVVITAADHWVATVPGESFTQGTLFYILDGAYAQGDGTKDLWLKLYRAKPNSARTILQFNNLQLDGGILRIKTNTDTIIPQNCQVAWEIQVAGIWYALSDVDSFILGQGGSVPPNLPFRATFIGTGDMMPAVTLPNAQITVSRPATALTHISKPIALPVSSSQIRIIQRYESWDAAHHAIGVKLRTGGTVGAGSTSYGTLVNPSSFSDVVGTDPQVGPYLERTYVFNLGAAVTSYVAQTDATTDTNRITFHVAWQKDYAL